MKFLHFQLSATNCLHFFRFPKISTRKFLNKICQNGAEIDAHSPGLIESGFFDDSASSVVFLHNDLAHFGRTSQTRTRTKFLLKIFLTSRKRIAGGRVSKRDENI